MLAVLKTAFAENNMTYRSAKEENYIAISEGVLLIAAFFGIIGNITGPISGHTLMPMES